jgi:hypothetical protein
VKDSATETIHLMRARARTPTATLSPVVTIDHGIKPEIMAKAEREFDIGRFHVGRLRRRTTAIPPPVVAVRHD